jgi:hypothetical protein
MDRFQLKSQFSESITKVGSQLHHIWANIPKNECKFGVTEAYWSNFILHSNYQTHFQRITKNH